MSLTSLQDSIDEKADYDLSENVVEDYIEYHRGRIIANEEQGLLGWLQLLTGWMFQMEHYVNGVYIGPPGGGKSLTQKQMTKLLPENLKYQTTDSTDNALLDDPNWDRSLCAPLDEYDKLGGKIREYMKSMAGEDGGYSKQRNVEDDDSPTGYSPVEVSSESMPFQVLYAPRGKKGGIDDELNDRMITIHVDDSREIREAIGRKEAGHEGIEITGYEEEYIYPTMDVERALRRHIRQLPTREYYEDIERDDGSVDEVLSSRRGGSFAKIPPWVWYSLQPIFDASKTYTNRVYGMIFNLIRASAVVNHKNRETVPMEIENRDGDIEEVDAYLVHPQDVANVGICQRALLSTTHELDPLKRDILEAVRRTSVGSDDGGTTVTRVKDWLEDNDKTCPSRSTLKDRLDALEEGYFLRKFESEGGPNGQADVYQFRDEGTVNPPRLTNLSKYADGDGVDLEEYADIYDVDVDDPYEDCWDPIRDQPFKQSVKEFDDEFSSSSEDDFERTMDAVDAMGGSDTDSGGGDSGQASLTDVDESGVSADSGDTKVKPDPEGEIENETELRVYDALEATCGDGQPFNDTHGIVHKTGAVDTETDVDEADADLTDTIFDPDHDLWQGRADLADDRVREIEDAKREIADAYASLRRKGIVVENDGGAPMGFTEIIVAEEV